MNVFETTTINKSKISSNQQDNYNPNIEYPNKSQKRPQIEYPNKSQKKLQKSPTVNLFPSLTKMKKRVKV